MNRELTLRITIDAALLISIIFGWWYIFIPLGLISLWIFPVYAELIVAAFIHDSLYGMNGVSGISGYTYLLAAIVATGLSALLKVVIKR